jgi:hypothetical protein
MRDLEYGIILNDGACKFYELLDDPFENNKLLSGAMTDAEQVVYDRLLSSVTALRETRSYAPVEIASAAQ